MAQSFVLGLLLQICVCGPDSGAAVGDSGPFQIFKSLLISWHLLPLPKVYPDKLMGKVLHPFTWKVWLDLVLGWIFFFISNLFNKTVLHFWVLARVF